MNIAAIIAEYNPFHNGHLYHIEETRRRTHADAVAVIMSGGFVERGEPAVLDKHIRARHAVECGADIVIELPCLYATSAAKYFADGAIRTLKNVDGVNTLSFGSECGDIDTLKSLAAVSENSSFDGAIKSFLDKGISYPIAYEKALEHVIKNCGESSDGIENLLKIDTKLLLSPNNVLGVEYIKAIKRNGAGIEPVTVLRKSADYRDETLPVDNVASAAAVRKALGCGGDVSNYVPINVLKDLENAPKIDTNRLFTIIAARLIDNEDFDCYEDNEGIVNRIRRALDTASSLEELIELTHTKRYTVSRIKRVMLHIALNHVSSLRFAEIDYARVLAVKKDRLDLLSAVRNQPSDSELYRSDAYADKIYRLIGGTGCEGYLQKV